MAATETEVDVGVVLPPFEPFSPGTPSSRGETQTKVRIAQLHMEAQDRAQARQAELDLRLEVRRLEIQADKEVRLRKLEIDAAKVASVPAVQQSSLSVSHNSANSGPTTFEVGKHMLWYRILGNLKWIVILMLSRKLQLLWVGLKMCGHYYCNAN